MDVRTDIFIEVMKCIMSVLGIIITAYVIPFIKTVVKPYIVAKIGEIETKRLISFIEDAVEWANQTIPAEEWERKKREVFNKCIGYADKLLNVDLTDEDIDTIIEAFVKKCKKEG